MPRIRSMKPEILGDEKLAPMPVIDRFVFQALILLADDAGRLVDNVKTIDGAVFPETDDTARESLDRLAANGRVLRYVSASGQRLIQLTNWKKHQKVDHPSPYTLPAPAEPPVEPPVQPVEAVATPASVPTEEVATVSRNPRETLARPSRSDQRSGSTISDQGAGAGATRAGAREAAPPAPLSSEPLKEPLTDPLELPASLEPIAPLLRGLRVAYYRDAEPWRWPDVVGQFATAVTGRLKLKRGEWVQTDVATLGRAIEATLARPPLEKPDSAVVYVLRKCMSGDAVTPLDAQGHLPAEAAAARERERQAAADREWAMREREALSWLAQAPPAVRDAIAAELEASAPSGGPSKGMREDALAGLRVHLIERRRAELGELAGVAG